MAITLARPPVSNANRAQSLHTLVVFFFFCSSLWLWQDAQLEFYYKTRALPLPLVVPFETPPFSPI